MTAFEAYQKGFSDAIDACGTLCDGSMQAHLSQTSNSQFSTWDPPNMCQENAKMQVRITEIVWEKVKYIIESEVLDEMKRMGVFGDQNKS